MFTLAAKLGDGELETLGMRMAARAEEISASLQERRITIGTALD
jgi:hypothetical protein